MRSSFLIPVGLTMLTGAAMCQPLQAAEYTITIDALKFGPPPADLRVGDVIIWDNKDFLAHTATARDQSFDVDLPAGAQGKTVLTKAGTFEFYCRFHPGMVGTLIVAPPT